jgi:hypothetical protein
MFAYGQRRQRLRTRVASAVRFHAVLKSSAFTHSLLAAIIIGVPGCSNVGRSLADASQSSLADSSIVRDLGVVAPNSVTSAEFEIVNPSSIPWTVSNIGTTCSCTVPRISSSRVPVGGSTIVALEYKAGSESADQRQYAIVEFEEEGVEDIRLEVVAHVRPPLTISTKNVQFDKRISSNTLSRYVVVSNWTDEVWLDLDCNSDIPGLLLAASLIRPELSGEQTVMPKQRWRVKIDASNEDGRDADASRFGTITFSPSLSRTGDLSRSFSNSMTVGIISAPPASVEPKSLLFGMLQPGATSEQTASLTLRPDMAELAAGGLTVSHAFGDNVTAEIESTKDAREFVLRAKVTSAVGRSALKPILNVVTKNGESVIATVPMIVLEAGESP